MLKNLQARLQQYLNWKFPDVWAGFRKGRGTRHQISNIPWIIENAREFQKTLYFCFIGYSKVFDCVDHIKLWTILKEMGIWDNLTSLLRNLYADQEATIITYITIIIVVHGQLTGSKLGKEYIKTVYCHPAYLTHMQSTSCEMPGWMKHKKESRVWLPGEIQIASDMKMTLP